MFVTRRAGFFWTWRHVSIFVLFATIQCEQDYCEKNDETCSQPKKVTLGELKKTTGEKNNQEIVVN